MKNTHLYYIQSNYCACTHYTHTLHTHRYQLLVAVIQLLLNTYEFITERVAKGQILRWGGVTDTLFCNFIEPVVKVLLLHTAALSIPHYRFLQK